MLAMLNLQKLGNGEPTTTRQLNSAYLGEIDFRPDNLRIEENGRMEVLWTFI